MLKPIDLAIVLVILPSLAVAQDIALPPVTTAEPGYLFPNDTSQRDRDILASSAQDMLAEIKLDAAAQARVRAAVEALVPEYNIRLQRHGETRANDWIRQKAFELGQQEAELMKQRIGLE